MPELDEVQVHPRPRRSYMQPVRFVYATEQPDPGDTIPDVPNDPVPEEEN